MKLQLSFKDYLKQIAQRANEPLSLATLTAPFGVAAPEESSSTLLNGHVLDDMAEAFAPDAIIDCLDVAAAAWELGFDPAGPFLEDAPLVMYRYITETTRTPFAN